MPAQPVKLDRAAFEAEIGEDDVADYRQELKTYPVAPLWRMTGDVFLLVRAGAEEAVTELFEGLSGSMRCFFEQMTSAKLDGWWKDRNGGVTEPIPGGRMFVRLGHSADRVYLAYENIYRGIRRLAPHVEDVRFVLTEDYCEWVDEYRIDSGELSFSRGMAEGQFVDDILDYLERDAQRRPDDPVWRRFCARELADWGAYHVGRAEHPTREPNERAESLAKAEGYLRRAVAVDADEPTVAAQMARLHTLEGRVDRAQPWFERHAALAVDAEVHLRAALGQICADQLADARRTLERLRDAEPELQLGHQLLGLVAAREGDRTQADAHARAAFERPVPNRARVRTEYLELVHRAGLHEPLLRAYLAAVEPKGAEQHELLARELLAWASLFRVKMCHDVDKPESTRLAQEFYERALACDPLAGEVATDFALFCRQTGRPELSEALLLQAVAHDREHRAALSGLGQAAFDSGRWAEAVRWLERAVERSLATNALGLEVGLAKQRLVLAMLHEGNRLLELGEPEPVTAADALFERAWTWVERLGFEPEPWFGAILQRSATHGVLGRHAEALVFAERAVELAPESVHALAGLASCLNNLGQLDDALAALELAAELDADHWYVPYVRACVLARRPGPIDVDSIAALLGRVLALDPSRRAQIEREPDLAQVREQPAIRRLL